MAEMIVRSDRQLVLLSDVDALRQEVLRLRAELKQERLTSEYWGYEAERLSKGEGPRNAAGALELDEA